MGLKEAIYAGGARRLKPIIMVAMASLISTAPILFSQGIGLSFSVRWRSR